jgi:hypothetical protein
MPQCCSCVIGKEESDWPRARYEKYCKEMFEYYHCPEMRTVIVQEPDPELKLPTWQKQTETWGVGHKCAALTTIYADHSAPWLLPQRAELIKTQLVAIAKVVAGPYLMRLNDRGCAIMSEPEFTRAQTAQLADALKQTGVKDATLAITGNQTTSTFEDRGQTPLTLSASVDRAGNLSTNTVPGACTALIGMRCWADDGHVPIACTSDDGTPIDLTCCWGPDPLAGKSTGPYFRHLEAGDKCGATPCSALVGEWCHGHAYSGVTCVDGSETNVVYCDKTSKKFERKRSVGEHCDRARDCESGHCSFNDGYEGQPGGKKANFEGDYQCRSARCLPLQTAEDAKKNPKACKSNAECCEGHCQEITTEAGNTSAACVAASSTLEYGQACKTLGTDACKDGYCHPVPEIAGRPAGKFCGPERLCLSAAEGLDPKAACCVSLGERGPPDQPWRCCFGYYMDSQGWCRLNV